MLGMLLFELGGNLFNNVTSEGIISPEIPDIFRKGECQLLKISTTSFSQLTGRRI